MAPRRRQRNTVLVAVYDKEEGHLVYRFNVKNLFSERLHGGDDEVLPLPARPLARFPHPPGRIERVALAAYPRGGGGGGAKKMKIVAATENGRTIVHDTSTKESSPGPDLQANDLCLQFEALRLQGGRCRAAAPVPPAPFDTLNLTACFVEGTRIWMNVDDQQGTYSLDMARRVWRKEGSWYLPIEDGAIYVPDLGLLLGFKVGRLNLCAYDIKANTPMILRQGQNFGKLLPLRMWRSGDLIPTVHDGYRFGEKHHPVEFFFVSLDYLGGGRFCIAWSSTPAPLGHPSKLKGCIFALTAVELTRNSDGELQLKKRRSRCYFLSRQQIGYMLR
ncbi:unnamed protein product [Urochloa decumbens]|uniref:DUF1618 domain-containing protein n=1 Tax=Urochloa decumbens TaxID=240449 RepID=A0ABC8XNH5_9POAL